MAKNTPHLLETFFFSQLSPEYGLHEAFKVLGHLVVDVETRVLRLLQLLLIDVAVGVADDGGKYMVWDVRNLGQRHELRAQFSNAPLHGLLHHSVAARCQEASVINRSAIAE